MAQSPTILAAIAALLFLSSCAEELATPEEALAWLSKRDNGLVQVREGEQVTWKATYLPNTYLAWRYLQSLDGYNQSTRDSVVQSYHNTLCFLLTVSPGTKEKGDVVMQGVGSFEDFQSRTMELNFHVQDLVRLSYGGVETGAVLSTMENTYGMNQERDIMVIFPKDETGWQRADTLDVLLDDSIYESGVHRFTFPMNEIQSIPALEIPPNQTNKQAR